MIKYVVDKDVNLDYVTNKGISSLSIIESRNFNETQIKLIGLKKVNIFNLITYYTW